MKKVLFYIHSLNKGGAERVLITLTNYLKKEYEIYILTDVYDELEYPLPDSIKRINMEGYLSQDDGHTRCTAIKRLLTIRRCIKKIKPDVVIAFMISSAIRAIIANLFTTTRIIAAIRSNPYDEYHSTKKRMMLQSAFFFTDKIVCQTKYQKEYFNKLLQRKCIVIFNPLMDEVNVDEFAGERTKRIVTTGRLFDYKNHKMLIDAFALIKQKFPDYTVTIYGEGPYREELEKEIVLKQLEIHVYLPGDSSKVAEDIKDASLFVLPSDTEGMPNALMEAMALGLPVISTDCPCGGPRSLIEQGVNGYLCKVGDAKELAEQMTEILSNKELREKLGKNARMIRKTCNLKTISKQWSILIDER